MSICRSTTCRNWSDFWKGVTAEGCLCGEIAGSCEEEVKFKRPVRRGDEGRTLQGVTGWELRRSLIRTGDKSCFLTFLRVGLNSIVDATTGTVDMLASFVVRETLIEEEIGTDWETVEAGIKPDFKSL